MLEFERLDKQSSRSMQESQAKSNRESIFESDRNVEPGLDSHRLRSPQTQQKTKNIEIILKKKKQPQRRRV